MTNISRKEQKAKLFTLNKENFVDELLSLQPKDYAERNWFYQKASIALSYPLQMISILAGSYLLFQMASFIWHLDLLTVSGGIAFAFCMVIFLGIEALRRWLVNTTGHHYVATYRNENGKIHKGEWLGAKRFWLIIISAILVSTGTLGIYQYIKNNQPKIEVVSVEEATSPLQNKIAQEKNHLSKIDHDRSQIQQAKTVELRDTKNYSEWNGKQFLLPEVKTRHLNYDKQLNALNQQRKAHLKLIAKYEDKLSHQENKTESKNEATLAAHSMSIEMYAGIGAGVWLAFEILLMFMLSYTWVYKFGVKKEMLLHNKKPNPQSKTVPKNEKTQKTTSSNSTTKTKKENVRKEPIKKNIEKKEVKSTTTAKWTKEQEKKESEKGFSHREFMQFVKNRKLSNPEDRITHAQLKEVLDGFPNPLNQKLWDKLLDRVNFAELQNKQKRMDKIAETEKKKAKNKKVDIEYQTTKEFLAFVKKKFASEIREGLVQYSEIKELIEEKCPEGGITNDLAKFIIDELQKFVEEAKQEERQKQRGEVLDQESVVAEVYGFKRFQDIELPQNQQKDWRTERDKRRKQTTKQEKEKARVKAEVNKNVMPDLQMANTAKANKNANKWKMSDTEVIELRNETGLSYAKIAEISGMSASRVSKLCNGKIEPKS